MRRWERSEHEWNIDGFLSQYTMFRLNLKLNQNPDWIENRDICLSYFPPHLFPNQNIFILEDRYNWIIAVKYSVYFMTRTPVYTIIVIFFMFYNIFSADKYFSLKTKELTLLWVQKHKLRRGTLACVPYTKKIEIGENIQIHGIENILLVGTVICIPWR